MTASVVDNVSLAYDAKSILGETPVCVSSGRVYIIDTDGKRIHWFDSVNSASGFIQTKEMIGCIAPRSTGGLIAALEASVVAVDVELEKIGETLATVPEVDAGPKFRFNDGKCDPVGRFWAGYMNHKEWSDPSSKPGKLYVLEKQQDGRSKLSTRLPESRLPNGMAWSSDSRLYFLVDSFYKTVDRYDYEISTGSISNRKTILSFPEQDGQPDGMAMDANDKLWVAMGEAGSIRQYDPETGTELLRVKLPVKRPTSCAFGGKDLSVLYITTREEPGENPSDGAGGVFQCRIPGVKGLSFADAYAG